MRIKCLTQDDDDNDDGKEKTNNNNPQRSPCKATNKNNGKREKGTMAKQGLMRGRSTPLKESFNKFRSSVSDMSKQVAERLSVLFKPSAGGSNSNSDTGSKKPDDDGNDT